MNSREGGVSSRRGQSRLIVGNGHAAVQRGYDCPVIMRRLYRELCTNCLDRLDQQSLPIGAW